MTTNRAANHRILTWPVMALAALAAVVGYFWGSQFRQQRVVTVKLPTGQTAPLSQPTASKASASQATPAATSAPAPKTKVS